MDITEKIDICSENYQKWKSIALSTSGEETKKALERAFFWLEMQSAFIALHSIERTADTEEARRKVLQAKIRLSRKLSDYAKELLDELDS